jgi:hypothetical protein
MMSSRLNKNPFPKCGSIKYGINIWVLSSLYRIKTRAADKQIQILVNP